MWHIKILRDIDRILETSDNLLIRREHLYDLREKVVLEAANEKPDYRAWDGFGEIKDQCNRLMGKVENMLIKMTDAGNALQYGDVKECRRILNLYRDAPQDLATGE